MELTEIEIKTLETFRYYFTRRLAERIYPTVSETEEQPDEGVIYSPPNILFAQNLLISALSNSFYDDKTKELRQPNKTEVVALTTLIFNAYSEGRPNISEENQYDFKYCAELFERTTAIKMIDKLNGENPGLLANSLAIMVGSTS